MADQITVSSTANPYQAGVYSAGSNSKNTMDVNSFIKLLAAQLSNQDMTSPMDNSEMMSQMTNMAMVQSLTAMTESLNTSAAVTTQTYAGSLIGQEITVAVTDPDTGAANGVKYGKVISVDFTQGDPVVRLEGDDTSYKMFYPQLGVKLCSMAGGGVQKIYMVFFKRTVPAGQVRQ